MSEALQVPLLVGFFTIAGVIVTQWFNSRQRQEDREQREQDREQDYKEWYSRTLFEKRLSVAQDAYMWLMKFNRQITAARPDALGSEANQALRQLCRDARDWYDKNAALLYDSLPTGSCFIGLINAADAYAQGETEVGIRKSYTDADREVRPRLEQLLSAERGGNRSGHD